MLATMAMGVSRDGTEVFMANAPCRHPRSPVHGSDAAAQAHFGDEMNLALLRFLAYRSKIMPVPNLWGGEQNSAKLTRLGPQSVQASGF